MSKGTSRSKQVDPKVSAAETPDEIGRGRETYGRRAWAEAHRWLARADERAPLTARDLELYVWSASLTGQDEEFLRLMERLYQLRLECGEQVPAAQSP